MIDIFSFDLISSLDLSHIGVTLAQFVPAEPAPSPTVVSPEEVQQCLDTIFSPDNAALSCGNMMSVRAAQAWDEIWNQKIRNVSPEFVATMNISRYIAGPAVALWAIDALKSFGRNGLSETWPRFMAMVILIAVLYGNNAAVARNTVLMARSLINYQNGQILELANAGNQYESKLEELADYGIVEREIIGFREQCNGITNNSEMLDCLTNAEVIADAALQDYYAKHPTGKFGARLERFAQRLIKDPKDFVGGVLGEGAAVGAGAVVGGPVGAAVVGGVVLLGKVANSAVTAASSGILANMNSLVQHVIEASWLFTAVTLPIPLALAFYPATRGTLTGWTIGFLSLGLFKINLNIASSLIVGMIYERGPGEPILDLALLSVGVIAMALGMTAGGGMVIFVGLTSAISSATFGIVNLAARKSA